MSPDRERWYRILFWIAAIYDLTLGIVFLCFYRPVFEALGIEDTLPEHTSFLSLSAAFLFVIGIAYVFFTRGVRGVPALEASLLLLVEPVLNPIWAWLAHGERPTGWAVLGGVIILTATAVNTVVAARRSEGRPRDDPDV